MIEKIAYPGTPYISAFPRAEDVTGHIPTVGHDFLAYVQAVEGIVEGAAYGGIPYITDLAVFLQSF